MSKLSINPEKNSVDEISITNFNPVSNGLNSSESFHMGLYHLYNHNIPEAKDHLTSAVNNTEPLDPSYFEYISYLGVVEVFFHQSRGGLIRCYEALKGFSNTTPELYINVASAELLINDRRRCILAVEKCLAENPDFPYKKSLRACIGKRKQAKSVSQRETIFGKMFRKNSSQCLKTLLDEIFHDSLSKKLESFIKTKA